MYGCPEAGKLREKRIFADPAAGVVGYFARRIPRARPAERVRGLLGRLDHPRERLVTGLVAVLAAPSLGVTTAVRQLRAAHPGRFQIDPAGPGDRRSPYDSGRPTPPVGWATVVRGGQHPADMRRQNGVVISADQEAKLDQAKTCAAPM